MLLFAFLTVNLMVSALGCKRVVCYYTNWAQYRPSPYTFYPENIDTTLCTHINYAFAKLNGNRLAPYEANDESKPWVKGMYEKLVDHVRKTNPTVKLLLAVGGWTMGSQTFTNMVATAAGREEFAVTSVTHLRERGFDGLDIDWEYPGGRGSPPADKWRFVELLKVISRVFEEEANSTGNPRLLLTAAVAAGKDTIENGYDVPEISKILDFINIMTYDLHGSWETVTGHVSPLYARSSERGYQSYLNVDWVVKHWEGLGLPKDKLVIGIPTYGRSFTLSSANVNGIGARTRGAGQAGTYTRTRGFLSYYEVCQMIKNGSTVTRDSEQRVPFAVLGDQWVGYEDEQSVREKVEYMLNNGYGGVMVWAYDLDDFNGRTCGDGTPYPLIKAIADQCAGNPSGVTFPTEVTQKHTTSATSTIQATTANSGNAKDTTPATSTIQATTVNSGNAKEFSCAGKTSGIHPSPDNCQDFYMCANGVAYLQRCPPGLVYNANFKTCDWPDSYVCPVGQLNGATAKQSSTEVTTPRTTTTSTVSKTTTTRRTTSSPTATIAASSTTTAATTTTTARRTTSAPTTTIAASPTTTAATTTTTTTTRRTTSSPTTTIAASPTTADATTTTTAAEDTTQTTSQVPTESYLDCARIAPGLYPSPNNCKVFLWCLNGVTYRANCPFILVFNPNRMQCDWPHNYPCTNGQDNTPTTTPQTDTFNEDNYCVYKEINGNYEDPRSCSHYFLCLGRVSHRMKCPDGRVFDPIEGYCNYPYRVPDCN